jgi:hypothetical protein
MIKKILLPVLYLLFVFIAACSSGNTGEYELLTKNDKQILDTFCDCTKPLQEFVVSFNPDNIDSSRALQLFDSMHVLIEEKKPCFEKTNEIYKRIKADSEFKDEVYAYLKKTHPDCYLLVSGKGLKKKTKPKK